MSLSLTADTAVCPSVQLGKVFHVQIMPAHIQGQISTVILCVRKYMAVGFRLCCTSVKCGEGHIGTALHK